jgi:putative transposase
MPRLQMFASIHASVSNHFYRERSLSSRRHFKLNRAAALVRRGAPKTVTLTF